MKHHPKDNEPPHAVGSFDLSSSKDLLGEAELAAGLTTIEPSNGPHAALETPDGKNNGAEPAVFENVRKART